MNETLLNEVRRLWETEKLSRRQIAEQLGLGRRRVAAFLGGTDRKPRAPTVVEPYERLIAEWYAATPSLKAIQVLRKLQSYGYPGGYTMVNLGTRAYRKKRPKSFHELEFLPGEAAQVDWMEWKPFYGFVYVLAYSRYAVVRFYPRMTMEFFLDGHLRAFREIGGVAHQHIYDNLKSVVLSRKPEVQFNPRFMEFSRYFGFTVRACTPGRPNEKGRVERYIRTLREELRILPTASLEELNAKVDTWRKEHQARVHRTTGKAPVEALREEKLLSLPALDFKPYRVVLSSISKTGFVEFETNRYSVPAAAGTAEVRVLPDTVEIVVGGKKIAVHRRLFDRKGKSETPAHRNRLLNLTPQFKFQRIYQLIRNLGPESAAFLDDLGKEGEDPIAAAYRMFQLLRGTSKETLLSAVREARSLHIHSVKYLENLFHPTEARVIPPVNPQDPNILALTYRPRKLDDYDDLF